MTPKQAAPPPPTGGFTGFVPNKPISQRLADYGRKRRQARQQARANRPPRPIITIHTGGSGTTRSRPRRRKYIRRPKRRGLLAATLGVTIAVLAVTAAVTEFVAWETAAELGTLAETISFGTMWFFGEPDPPKQPRPAKPTKQRQPAAQQGSGGHKCGATTQDGSKCGRPVKATTGPDSWCFDHPGGKSKPGSSSSSNGQGRAANKPSGPKRTRKIAPPPSAPANP